MPKKKKIIIIAVVILAVFYLIGELGKIKNTNDDGKVVASEYTMKEYPVINGTGDKQIGTRLEIIYPKDNLSDEEIIKIYNDKIKNSSHNWVTIKLNNNYGIRIGGGTPILDFGYLDESGAPQKVEKTGVVKDNIIDYK